MKFYYNGKLMRTSKTHTYTHALLTETGTLRSCHGSREAAEKELRALISQHETNIDDCKRAIKAIEKGQTYYFAGHRQQYKCSLKGKTIEHYEEWIEKYKRIIAFFEKHQIVELEARA